MKFAYIRVSTTDQNLDRQLKAMKEQDIEDENIYHEKESGKDVINRPVLQELMKILRKGDTLVIESISRLARNTKDLIDIVEKLHAKGVELISLKELLDTSSITGKFMITMFGAIAELERGYLKQRQKEGIEIAKANKVYKGRKKIEPDKKEFALLYKDWKEGKIKAVRAMQLLGLTRNTFYRRVEEYEEKLKLQSK